MVTVPLGKGHVRGTRIEDFDRDGRPEVIASCNVDPSDLYFLVDFGKGRKPRVRRLYGAPTFLWDLEIRDLDRDGLPDLIGSGWGGTPRIDFKFNNGAGAVRLVGSLWPLDPKQEGRRGYGISVGDIDANGLDDIALADGQRVVIFQGEPNLSFQPRIALPDLPRPVDVLLADIDADGRDDLLVVNDHPMRDLREDLAVLRNTGTGIVGHKFFSVGAGVQSLAAADFDGDGNLDVALACSLGGEVVILHGDGTGDFGREIRQATGTFEAPLDLERHRAQLERYRADPAACVKGEWGRRGVLEGVERGRRDLGSAKTSYGTPVSALRLGDVALVFHPSELYSVYGLAIRRDSPFAETIVVGYTDDLIGYVPDPKAYETGEYSALVVPKILDLPPFKPDVGRRLQATAIDLLKRLKD
ncbi:MAG: VCBS repeat-containing protein [Planctomycetes bacterium]|nr:VCBS repeat-containing protein [Planctomycetota bacterium]